MSSPRILSNKKNFTTVNDAWKAYYSENEFAISADIQKSLKYIPIYYQKKNLTAMAAAYSLWNSAEQRFEIFCPKNAVFRSTNLHELGHIYFGHLKNSRKYIAMAEKTLEPYKDQIANFLGLSWHSAIRNIINVCMDFEINSKLFVTKKEREELNASVQFYLLRNYNTSVIQYNITNFNPDKLSKETVIYFPENFGFPGKKSFLEYIQMLIDYCIHHKKPEIPQNGNHDDLFSSGSKGTVALSLPDNSENASKNNNTNGDSPFNKEDENNSDKETQLPSFNKNKSNDLNDLSNNDKDNNASSPDTPQIEDIDEKTFAERFRVNCDTEEQKNRISYVDSCYVRKKEPLYEINGETLDYEIYNAKYWMLRHDEEEEQINNLKDKIDIAYNASEINNFILNNALPSIDITSYNDILYNYNRGKTTDVFINKVRTRSTFRKPNIHIYTDISGSMDADYTKKIVKAVKAISSRIDTRSSITFYNGSAQNTEKFITLSDEVINKSFIGGGTELAHALNKTYVKSQENNSANTLVIISDFQDDLNSIKKSFDNINSTIICIEVGNNNENCIADEFKEYGINNAKLKLMKIVDRQYAA